MGRSQNVAQYKEPWKVKDRASEAARGRLNRPQAALDRQETSLFRDAPVALKSVPNPS